MEWLSLPELIFSDIILMVGLDSLESLHRCRQVCSAWNEMILQDIWENQRKKKIMRERIERSWGPDMLPSNEQISHARWLEARGILDTGKIEKLIERVKNDLFEEVYNRGEMDTNMWMCAASLAHNGMLGSVDKLTLWNVDLSPVPAKHLASLASCVTIELYIQSASGCDLVSTLTSLKCPVLGITKQSLGREETQALVQAMESGVEKVWLSDGVTLDIETLTEYSGQGVCRDMELWGTACRRYREELRTWAKSRNWRLDHDEEYLLLLEY